MAEEANLQGKPIMGVKGQSILARLPGFNLVEGFVVDSMHCVDFCVMRQLANLWFDSRNHLQPWYIGNKVSVVDESLLRMLPPSNIRRTPRSLITKMYWKASEWRAFLLFYGPVVLKDVLPSAFYRHFIVLSAVMFTLQSECISQLELFYASSYLKYFVANFAKLYGVNNMSFNVHQLVHISDCVFN